MKLRFTKGDILSTMQGTYMLSLELHKQNIEGLMPLLQDDKVKTIEIKHERKKRSLDANGAMWLLLDELAKKLHTNKEELYLDYVKRYGVFTWIGVLPKAFEELVPKGVCRVAIKKSESTINNVKVYGVECYHGTSTYDSAEFSRLLEQIVLDAEELGITLISKADMDLMMANYEKG